MTHLLDTALHYAQRYGWAVHPVGVNKEPITAHGRNDATRDEVMIRRFFRNGAQLAIATGAESGLFVLDVDVKPEKGIDGRASLAYLETMHGALPRTPQQRTGSGGTQYLFRYAEGLKNTQGKLGAGLDTRGAGGYIVVAPSRNASGPYEWIVSPDDAPLADAPAWLVDLLLAEPAQRSTSSAPHIGADSTARDWAAAQLGKAVTRVMTAPDGQKHDTLLKMARLGGGLVPHLSESEIEAALFAAIEPRADDPRNARQTILDGIAHGKTKPLAPPAQWAKSDGAAPADASDDRAALPKSQRIALALADLGYAFRLNLCSHSIEVNGEPIDDILAARIRTEMRDQDFKSCAAIEDVYTTIAAQRAYHPIKEYLDRLVWDGRPHIEALGAYLTCDDPPVVYANGTSCPLATVYLWRWLIGAVAKVYEQAQNLMLVLCGAQDIGKSAFARWLCSGIPAYFIEAPINVADKDTDVRLMERFIWEVAELDATTRKADVSALKAFITKQTVTVRKAYGRHDTIRPALASFIGTVNDGSGFLADETGNRRFYVTRISAIDWSYAGLDVNQVWAQAVHLYLQGESWRLLPVESTAQTEANHGHEVDGLLEDWIARHFYLSAGDTALSAAEIVDHLRQRHDIRLNGSDRTQAMEIARVMTKLGVPKRRREGKGVREYVGIWPKQP